MAVNILSTEPGPVVTVAVDGRCEPRMKGELDVAVDTDGGVKDAALAETGRWFGEGDRSVMLAVEVEAEHPTIEVEQDSDDTSGRDAALGAGRVDARVHEPATSSVDVHAPALAVSACNKGIAIGKSR